MVSPACAASDRVEPSVHHDDHDAVVSAEIPHTRRAAIGQRAGRQRHVGHLEAGESGDGLCG